ncbi:MAG: PAS domain S-box protein, partial [Candidatus Peregrinibacteria bacterium]|nr:PAS domain S-box protein [Candidatus Peregrinibacteria bacterium]
DMYQDLVERMNEAIILADGEENTVYANPKFCEILGISMEETLNKKTYDFFDQETAEKIRYENEHKRKQGLSSRYEGKLVNKKGEKIPVLVNGTPLPGGGSLRLLTDLTEVKKSEEKERALNSAVMYATDAIIIFNSEGEITSWNKGAKVIFGYKLEEINGKSIKTIFSEEDVDQLISEGKLLYNIELEGRHKNNKPVNISATLTPVKKGNKKKATSFLLIARDITNQAKFEEELTLKYEKMKEAYNQFGVLRRQMDYMFEVLNFFSEEHDTKTMADFFVSSIIMLTHVDACVLRLYNIKKDSLDLLSSFGVGENWKGKASIKYPKSLAEKAFDRGAALKIIDVVREPRYQSKYLAKKNNLCSLLLIPLKFQSKFVGSLSLYVNPDKRLEIFENEFIEKYAKLIEMAVGTMFKPTST